MADNITYSTISLNCNTKKRKTEEDTILSLIDDVNNVILSEDPLISAEFNVSQGYRVQDEYFVEVSDIELSTLDITEEGFPTFTGTSGYYSLRSVFLNSQFVKAPRPSIQQHHDVALDWVCSSIDVEGYVTLYDSFSTGRFTGELAVQLAFLYGNDADHELKVTLAPIQQQEVGVDCGLFAATVCLTIATGGDPTQVYWKQSRMRSHLTDCLNSKILTPYPKIESIALQSRLTTNLGTDLKIMLWCLCHLPSCASKNMIECPKCLKWSTNHV
ncbi:hypothetical protein LOD99_10300 [Oopsacas minuta]|uniref:Ubiquitin-like protease family profile domain-containing protein n=1 Tax=Oopsacas minuta TaxID=111878 RepID=A0AAV7KHV5_9METZ|nr:hypothetical protein LOD99_10300 [Oopsacas minuta]